MLVRRRATALGEGRRVWLPPADAAGRCSLECGPGVPRRAAADTELAGLLLAEYRQAEDVWLHWQIKRANFDTWYGYDLDHLFAAGVHATIAFVRDSGHAYGDEVLERLLDQEGQPCVSEEGLAAWSQRSGRASRRKPQIGQPGSTSAGWTASPECSSTARDTASNMTPRHRT